MNDPEQAGVPPQFENLRIRLNEQYDDFVVIARHRAEGGKFLWATSDTRWALGSLQQVQEHLRAEMHYQAEDEASR